MRFGVGRGLAFSNLKNLARRDGAKFNALLVSHGRAPLAASDLNNLIQFAHALYQIAGVRVDFWPLRAQHNMGTGATCYSWLGAVGTLVNGPTWGVDGLAFNRASSQYVSLPTGVIVTGSNPRTAFCAFNNPTRTLGEREFVYNMGVGLDNSFGMECNNDADTFQGSDSGASTSTVAYSLGVFNTTTYGRGGTGAANYILQLNGGSAITGTGDTLNTNNAEASIGRLNSSLGFNFGGIVSAFLLVPSFLTEAQGTALYAAFKRYLGSGLGLPNSVLDDLNAYVSSVAGLGGNISATEQANLLSFATQLYGIAGRTDFWALRSGQNVGTGATCYSWLGAVGTLVNGATWATDGIHRSPGSSQYLTVPTLNIATAGQFSLGCVAKINAAPTTGEVIGLVSQQAPSVYPLGPGGTAAISFYTDSTSNNEVIVSSGMTGGDGQRSRDNNNGAGTIVGTGFHCWLGSIGSASSFSRALLRDGVSEGTDNHTGTAFASAGTNAYLMRDTHDNTTYDATIAFALAHTVALSVSQLQSINTALASTIHP